jgi:hypothetical protein
MNNNPFDISPQAQGGAGLDTNPAQRTAEGTSASMHARATPTAQPADFGNTLHNKGIQDHICKGAMEKVAEIRQRARTSAMATHPWQLVGE